MRVQEFGNKPTPFRLLINTTLMSNRPATTEVRGIAASQGARSATDDIGLGQLVDTYHAALYRYAYRLTGSAADAEDLTQQVFLIAAQKLEQVRNARSIGAWLYAVLRNSYLREERRLSLERTVNLPIDLEELPEQVLEDEIDREQLQLALNELPDEYRLIVLMFYFEDCTYREIAERLELPIGTVMSRLSRGKGHLRRHLLARVNREPLNATPSKHREKRPIPWMT